MSSGVEFDNQPQRRYAGVGQTEDKGLIGFMVRKGIAKNTSQAQFILIIILIVILAVIWFVLNSSSSSSDPKFQKYDPVAETERARKLYSK